MLTVCSIERTIATKLGAGAPCSLTSVPLQSSETGARSAPDGGHKEESDVDDETIQRALGATMTRRRLIQLGGLTGLAVLASPVLAACGAGSTASPGAASSQAAGAASSQAAGASASASASKLTGSLVVNIESGSIADAVKKAWLDPFAASTGVNCVADQTNPDLAKLTAMIQSGQPPTLDMYVFAPNGIKGTDYPKYFEPIDYTLINKDLLFPGFFGDEWIASSIDSYVLGYNTKSTGGKAPTGWADLFDLQGFAGKRAFEDRWETSCMVALMADGVAPDKLIPIDVDRALAKLTTIKSNIVMFTSGTQIQELVASGETPLAMTFNGRVKASVDEGATVAACWTNQLVEFAQFAIVKGTPNKTNAMQFLAFATSTAHAGDVTKYIAYPSANRYAKVDPANAVWVPSAYMDKPYAVIDSAAKDWINDQYSTVQPKWDAFKTSL